MPLLSFEFQCTQVEEFPDVLINIYITPYINTWLLSSLISIKLMKTTSNIFIILVLGLLPEVLSVGLRLKELLRKFIVGLNIYIQNNITVQSGRRNSYLELLRFRQQSSITHSSGSSRCPTCDSCSESGEEDLDPNKVILSELQIKIPNENHYAGSRRLSYHMSFQRYSQITYF